MSRQEQKEECEKFGTRQFDRCFRCAGSRIFCITHRIHLRKNIFAHRNNYEQEALRPTILTNVLIDERVLKIDK